jgi:hypothetical protein
MPPPQQSIPYAFTCGVTRFGNSNWRACHRRQNEPRHAALREGEFPGRSRVGFRDSGGRDDIRVSGRRSTSEGDAPRLLGKPGSSPL